MPTPENTPTHPFLQQVNAKGYLLLESMPTKTIDSSMHNDEICSVCVGLLYFVISVPDNKQMHLSSSS